MNGRRIRTLVVVAVLALVGVGIAQAQTPALTVAVDSQFVAIGKTLAKGTYTVDITPAGNAVLTPEGGGASLEMPALKKYTRNVKRVELVFDIVGDMKFLSEVWVPGKGAVKVGSQPESAERVSVHGAKAGK
jgi:hypothetical protein